MSSIVVSGQPTTLALFVHGLGADVREFWGTTSDSLPADRRLHEAAVKVKFWGYPTNKNPRFWAWLNGSPNLQSLEQLGEHLCSDLPDLMRSATADNLVLFGHSMGGLILAAALGRELQNSYGDKPILKAVAFCGTPLGGAILANKTSPLFRLAGENIQVDDLRQDSRSRKAIVNSFYNNYLLSPYSNWQVFRASDDEVVQANELWGEFPHDRWSGTVDVLRGNHSGCVFNLLPDSDNYGKLVGWILKSVAVSVG